MSRQCFRIGHNPALDFVHDLFRFGASSLLNDVLMQIRKEKSGAYQSGDYFTLD